MDRKTSSRSQAPVKSLAIIAAVLGITILIAAPLTGGAEEDDRRYEVLIEDCRVAAAQCSLRRAAFGPNVECEFCWDRCVDAEGEPLFPEDPGEDPTSIDCCTLGMADQVYVGSDASECLPYEEYELEIDGGTGGAILEPGAGTHEYEENSTVTIEASPDTGYEFAQWTGDTQEIENENLASTSITMLDDYSITATFEEEPEEYTLTIDTVGEGSTTPSEGEHTYEETESVTVTADPADGWIFDEWTGDCTGDSCELDMDSDKSVTANFDDADCDPGETQNCTRCCDDDYCDGDGNCIEGESCDTGTQECQDDGTWGTCDASPSPCRSDCTSDSGCQRSNCDSCYVDCCINCECQSNGCSDSDCCTEYKQSDGSWSSCSPSPDCSAYEPCSSGDCEDDCYDTCYYDCCGTYCCESNACSNTDSGTRCRDRYGNWGACDASAHCSDTCSTDDDCGSYSPGQCSSCEKECWYNCCDGDGNCVTNGCSGVWSGQTCLEDCDGTWSSCDACDSADDLCSSDADCDGDNDNGNDDECGGCDDGLICCDCDGSYICVTDCPGGCPQ